MEQRSPSFQEKRNELLAYSFSFAFDKSFLFWCFQYFIFEYFYILEMPWNKCLCAVQLGGYGGFSLCFKYVSPNLSTISLNILYFFLSVFHCDIVCMVGYLIICQKFSKSFHFYFAFSCLQIMHSLQSIFSFTDLANSNPALSTQMNVIC